MYNFVADLCELILAGLELPALAGLPAAKGLDPARAATVSPTLSACPLR